MKRQRPRPAAIVKTLIRHLHHCNLIEPEAMREDRARTTYAGRALAKSCAQSFGLRQPFVAKTGRTRDKTVASAFVPAIQRLFEIGTLAHDAATIAEEDVRGLTRT